MFALGGAALISCAPAPVHHAEVPAPLSAGPQSAIQTVPLADHHTHLFSYDAVARVFPPLNPPAISLPADVARLLAERSRLWNDPAGLAALYSRDAVVYRTRVGPAGWVHGGDSVAAFVGRLFGVQYRVIPVAFEGSDSIASLAGYFAREVPTGLRYFGTVLLTLKKEAGSWRIAGEMQTFPGPRGPESVGATQLIAQLDAAGIRKALVLSTAYWFSSAGGTPVENEQSRVRAENDFVAAEVARFPDRLVGFCSVNPLRAYAREELAHCASVQKLEGVKLHFGDAGVDLLDPADVEKVADVFAAINALRLPVMVHLMTGDAAYGAAHSRAFLNSVLPAAPDISIQIAHMAGSGPGYNSDSAFAVFAEAARARDPRMKNVYVDVATVVTMTMPRDELALVARRLREFGLDRVLYASDTPASLDITPESGWLAFRRLPLSDQEFQTVAGNVAPYMR